MTINRPGLKAPLKKTTAKIMVRIINSYIAKLTEEGDVWSSIELRENGSLREFTNALTALITHNKADWYKAISNCISRATQFYFLTFKFDSSLKDQRPDEVQIRNLQKAIDDILVSEFAIKLSDNHNDTKFVIGRQIRGEYQTTDIREQKLHYHVILSRTRFLMSEKKLLSTTKTKMHGNQLRVRWPMFFRHPSITMTDDILDSLNIRWRNAQAEILKSDLTAFGDIPLVHYSDNNNEYKLSQDAKDRDNAGFYIANPGLKATREIESLYYHEKAGKVNVRTVDRKFTLSIESFMNKYFGISKVRPGKVRPISGGFLLGQSLFGKLINKANETTVTMVSGYFDPMRLTDYLVEGMESVGKCCYKDYIKYTVNGDRNTKPKPQYILTEPTDINNNTLTIKIYGY